MIESICMGMSTNNGNERLSSRLREESNIYIGPLCCVVVVVVVVVVIVFVV